MKKAKPVAGEVETDRYYRREQIDHDPEWTFDALSTSRIHVTQSVPLATGCWVVFTLGSRYFPERTGSALGGRTEGVVPSGPSIRSKR